MTHSRSGTEELVLRRIAAIEQELRQLKLDILRSSSKDHSAGTLSLFGSVKAGDITEEMIDQAQKTVLRDVQDI